MDVCLVPPNLVKLHNQLLNPVQLRLKLLVHQPKLHHFPPDPLLALLMLLLGLHQLQPHLGKLFKLLCLFD